MTTDSNHGWRVYPNLARTMVLTGVDQLWVADLTYIRLSEEFVFLAVILDAYSPRHINSVGCGYLRSGIQKVRLSSEGLTCGRKCSDITSITQSYRAVADLLHTVAQRVGGSIRKTGSASGIPRWHQSERFRNASIL